MLKSTMRTLGISCKLETWGSLLFLIYMTSLSVNYGCDKPVASSQFVPDYTLVIIHKLLECIGKEEVFTVFGSDLFKNDHERE